MTFSADICDLIIEKLYDISKANSKVTVPSTSLEGTISNSQTSMDCLGYLESKGLINILYPKPTGSEFDLISITSSGIEYVEKRRERPRTTIATDGQISNENVIFISYARPDYDSAKKLYDDLKAAGLNPWIDKINLLPGANWDSEIRTAIRNCSFFLPLLSKQSIVKKGYYQRELKLGIEAAEEVPDGQIFFIPLRLDDCPVFSEKLSKYNYQDMFPDWPFAIDRIIESIQLTISHMPLKTEIEPKLQLIDASTTRSVERLKEEILAGSSISISISKMLDPTFRTILKPVDVVWLKNELYGYSFTDENNRKKYIQNEDILPGNPSYRNVKGEIRIMFGNQFNDRNLKVVKYPLFLGQPVSDLERMSDQFEKYQVLINIPIETLSQDQLSAIKELNSEETHLPVHLTKPEIDKCLSELRLRLHRCLSEV